MCAICSLLGKPRAPLNVTRTFYKMARSQLHTVLEGKPDVDTVYAILALAGCSIAVGDVECGKSLVGLGFRMVCLLNLDQLSISDRGAATLESDIKFRKTVYLLRTCITADLCRGGNNTM
ncbi:hypothetical protein BC829DRAFT_398858 [Chytridium lagenaria]|nr:hypothetical protein BC829DRAFT_398858 [Chytridium lagenaria]